MKRRLSAVLALVCLLISLALCVVWGIATRYRCRVVYSAATEQSVELSTGPHQLAIDYSSQDALMRTLQRRPLGFYVDAATWGSMQTFDALPLSPGGVQPAGFFSHVSIPVFWVPIPNAVAGFGWSVSHPPITLAEAMSSKPGSGTSVAVVVPYWFLILLAALPPARWAWRRQRHQRRLRNGQCLVCGYDLRSTPERCPECGTVPA